MEMTTPMATQAKITPILGVEGGKTQPFRLCWSFLDCGKTLKLWVWDLLTFHKNYLNIFLGNI